MHFCYKCGNQASQDSRYCSHCGEPLQEEMAAIVEGEERSRDKVKKNKSIWPVFVPIFMLVLVSSALYLTYSNEQKVNDEVMRTKEQAGKLALQGNYQEAEKLFAKAIDRRPDFAALQQDINNVRSVIVMNEGLEKVGTHIQDNRLTEAKNSLSTIQNEMADKNSRLVATLTPRVNKLESKITVRQINNDVNKLTSVDELAAKLNTLSGLNLEEASKVREKITERIVSLTTKEAVKSMDQKHYREAVTAVDRGLQYVSNDKKLVQLKERIKQEQAAFEQEQHDRIEQAMEQAAEDELKNLNDALELVNINLEKDDYGDVEVRGELKSVATEIISTVTVSYDILNEDGEVVASNSAKVYPMYLNPGDQGTFEKAHYDLKGELKVELTKMEWLVE